MMGTIHIRRHLDSHVLDLPEITSMVGKDVEIIVIETPSGRRADAKVIEAQAAEQPTRPVPDVQSLLGGWPIDQRDDGFEEDLERRNHKNPVPPLREE